MFFSIIRLRQNVSPKDIVGLGTSYGYQLHKLIWNLFSDGSDRSRDFLYRYEAVYGWPTFYTVSKREPNDPSNLWNKTLKVFRFFFQQALLNKHREIRILVACFS